MAIWDDYNWSFWDPTKEPLPETPSTFRKVSLCTTCMNRTYDLKKTFLRNLADNIEYPNVEFVLLNYNSQDDMDEWVKKYLMGWIEDGIISYFKTIEPEFYDMGHSRNVAFKAAAGDIVNNIDADNYTNRDFASYINKLADIQPKNAVFVKGKRMMHGRLGFYKDEFIASGGYDEELIGYGFDDHNLLYRHMNHGSKMMWWNKLCPMDRIKTPNDLKSKNMETDDWKETEKLNKQITMEKIENGFKVANQGKNWGHATLIKNFTEIVEV